jgi:O-antigen ligase
MQKINVIALTKILVALAFLVLITFSPSIHFIPYIEYHDCQRVLQLLLLAFVLIDAVIVNFGNTNGILVDRKVKLGLFVLLVLAIASSASSIEPRQAIIEISIFAALCYLTLFVAKQFNDNKETFIKQLTYALLASILLYMVTFYVGYAAAVVDKIALAWPKPFYGFSNIRLFQQYQLWGLGFIVLPLLAFDLKKKARNWLYIALTCWWVLLYYAASRGVTLGWLIAMAVTSIFYQKLAWPFLRVQLINATTGLAGYLVLFKAIPFLIMASATSGSGSAIVTSTIFRDTTYDRLDLWKVAYVMIKNFPFFGVGPMNFYFYNNFGTHPHNSILQIASEWGLPATFIMLAILGYSFNCWYKRFNASKLQTATKLDSNLSVILFFTIIANGAYSLVEGVIVMPISQVLMFTTIGLMIGQYTLEHVTITKSSKFRFRPIFAGLVLVALVLSTMPELVRGLTSYQRYYQPGERAFSMGPDTINPRIWMQQRRIEPDTQKQKENKDTN